MSRSGTRGHGKASVITSLADIIARGEQVVFITGAGLSAASGIPTFRGTAQSTWSTTSTELGRRSVFLRDPLHWYNTFWLRYFPYGFTMMPSNAGHEAIAQLAGAHPSISVITQNIDTLHQQTCATWRHEDKLIEVHGRLGLYKCVAQSGSCLFARQKPITVTELGSDWHVRLHTHPSGVKAQLPAPPRCPGCGQPAPPMALLFDEEYESHAFYQFNRAMQWMDKAAAFVFVGTSNSVSITRLALQKAKKRAVPVYEFNLHCNLQASPGLHLHLVSGPAEQTLPLLAAEVAQRTAGGLGGGGGTGGPVARAEASMVPGPLAAPARCSAHGGTPPPPWQPLPEQVITGHARFHLGPVPARPLGKGDVRVELSASYGRRIHADPQVEADIEFIWESTLLRNPRIFNGLKFRLAGYTLTPPRPPGGLQDLLQAPLAPSTASQCPAGLVPSEAPRLPSALQVGESTQQPGVTGGGVQGPVKASTAFSGRPIKPVGDFSAGQASAGLVLRVGLTDYKAYLGTNLSPRARVLAEEGLRDFGDSAAYLSHKLGVGAVVETTDGHVLVISRSAHVAEGAGKVDVPGGHPEPEKLGLDPGREASLSPADRSDMELQVVQELFDSIAGEIADETNVPMSALSEPLLLGVVQQGNSCGTPSVAFQVRCALTAKEVRRWYAAGPREAFETTVLHCVPAASVLDPAFLRGQGWSLTPSMEGCLALWAMHIQGHVPSHLL